MGGSVPQSAERLMRKLLLTALGLLDRQDVDVAALQPREDPVETGPDGVDVPGGDAHGGNLLADRLPGVVEPTGSPGPH